ncbi:MAG: hypothetical protein NT072_09780 [Deltaproteobacteria bacterium]|nr:hypothetical protein [Deltaproteobacteria bacterium]
MNEITIAWTSKGGKLAFLKDGSRIKIKFTAADRRAVILRAGDIVPGVGCDQRKLVNALLQRTPEGIERWAASHDVLKIAGEFLTQRGAKVTGKGYLTR